MATNEQLLRVQNFMLSTDGFGTGESAPTMENAYYRVRTNARGEILSIYDKTFRRELLDGVANRFLYTRDNHKSWSDEELLGAKIVRRARAAARVCTTRRRWRWECRPSSVAR